MYFGKLEIESDEDNVLLTTTGERIEITDENRKLISDAPKSGSDMADEWIDIIADEFFKAITEGREQTDTVALLLDILAKHNCRLVDISKIWDTVFSEMLTIKNSLDTTITAKNDERIVELLGKKELDDFARVFGAKEDAPSNSIRSIRFNDIF